jgi:hypothetical protein
MMNKTDLEKTQADMRERWAAADQSERWIGSTLLERRLATEEYERERNESNQTGRK